MVSGAKQRQLGHRRPGDGLREIGANPSDADDFQQRGRTQRRLQSSERLPATRIHGPRRRLRPDHPLQPPHGRGSRKRRGNRVWDVPEEGRQRQGL